MALEKKNYKYRNVVARDKLHELVDILLKSCDGYDVKISDCIKDKYGYYSEGNFRELLDNILDNYTNYSRKYNSNESFELELSDEEKDYIKTLMYVGIRALQANLEYVYMSEDESYIDELSAMSGDDFKTLFSAFTKNDNPRIGERELPVSDGLAASATTLYHILTGTYKSFPTPYDICERVKSENEPIPDISEFSDLIHEQHTLLEDYKTEILEDKEWAFDEYEELEELEEDREYVMGHMIFDLSDKEQAKKYEKEAKRISLSFAKPNEFIQMYDYLEEITSEKFSKLRLQNIIYAGLKSYLENNNYTLYTHLEKYADVLDCLFDAQNIIDNLKEV